jgi:ABC-type transport system involved in multi-copper enzyme maturation permease subunit
MLTIIRRQILDILLDAKFIFMALLVLLAFSANGVIFTNQYRQSSEDYQTSEAENGNLIRTRCDNLQRLAIMEQRILTPPSALAFIAEGNSGTLPNVAIINAFSRYSYEFQQRTDDRIPVLPSLDWSFIVGILMTLLAILVGYNAVCGERRDGTLRLVLAQPVSRLILFIGKYLGMLLAIIICFLAGVIINLLIFVALDGPPIDATTVLPIAWAVLLSLFTISLFVLAGLMVSSMTQRPAVSLVILLVFWIIVAFALPGLGRLVAEQIVSVPSQADERAETSERLQQAADSVPPNQNFWGGDPFAPNIVNRGKLWTARNEAVLSVSNEYVRAQIDQASLAKLLAYISPQGIISDSFQKLSSTGIYGFRQLHENSNRYRTALFNFVVNRDATDSGTPHLVYGGRGFTDTGVFSQKPVPYEAVPRASTLWTRTGLPTDTEAPLVQLLILFAANLNMALVAFIALARYDPR